MIDWDKWWFYEDEQVEIWWFSKWVCLKYPSWGNGKDDPGHPSPSSHEKFCKEIIIPILENTNG